MFNTGRTGGGGGAKTPRPLYTEFTKYFTIFVRKLFAHIYVYVYLYICIFVYMYICIFVYLYMLPKAGQNFKFFSFEIQFFLINYDLFKITGNGCAGPLRYINISPILRVMS